VGGIFRVRIDGADSHCTAQFTSARFRTPAPVQELSMRIICILLVMQLLTDSYFAFWILGGCDED
jgi:hypothetical protein